LRRCSTLPVSAQRLPSSSMPGVVAGGGVGGGPDLVLRTSSSSMASLQSVGR
jgi:hypothetical protein